MIMYVDTSSVMKRYVEEEGFQQTRELVAQVQILTTSIITYVEMRSALAHKYRTGEVDDETYQAIGEDFERDWSLYASIPVDHQLVGLAGLMAERHALRALDSIHLASALGLAHQTSEPLVFLSADANLLTAASRIGLATS